LNGLTKTASGAHDLFRVGYSNALGFSTPNQSQILPSFRSACSVALPVELWTLIFEYMPRRELCTICTVSSSFQQLATPILYRYVYLSDVGLDGGLDHWSEQVAQRPDLAAHVRVLSFRSQSPPRRVYWPSIRHLNITQLSFRIVPLPCIRLDNQELSVPATGIPQCDIRSLTFPGFPSIATRCAYTTNGHAFRVHG
jgi:hypothetical protein